MAGLLALLAVLVWAPAMHAPPAARIGATAPSLPAHPVIPEQRDPAAMTRRAEIAAEEARLAALRDARRQLVEELEALRQAADAFQRPAPPTAAEPMEVPAGPPLRILVMHRANSAPAAAAASALAETLRGSGFEVQALRGVAFVPSTPLVRYFHAADRAAAASLAARLGQGWTAQDFQAFQPQPAPRTIEVWLPTS